MKSVDIILEIISKNKNIKEIYFMEFPKQIAIQEKIKLTKFENKCVTRALKIRNTLKLPFWDSLMLSFINLNNTSSKLLRESLRHNAQVNSFPLLANEKLIQRKIIKNEKNLAFLSKVKLSNGKIYHLPLLDFHIPNDSKNLQIVENVLHSLGLNSGYILQTNNSFHFYGKNLLTKSQLRQMLIKALFFSPIIDKNWIAHQLLEECCALRIGRKLNKIPFLLKRLS